MQFLQAQVFHHPKKEFWNNYFISILERFQIDEKNSAIASRIIKDTLAAELIKEDDPSSSSRKFAKYIPFWA